MVRITGGMKSLNKTTYKRFYALASVLILIFSVTAAMPAASAEAQAAPLYRSEYQYPSGEFDRPVTDTYYYSDRYFMKPGTKTNEHLRTMSAALAFGVSPANNEKSAAENITDIFTDTGFDVKSISAEEMDVTRKDSVGTVIAHKSIENTQLIAVVIRGYDYKTEWVSNVTAGADGDPKGFSDSANKVLGRIKAYMQNNDIIKAKFWITGFSRAGAISNLVGKRINENLSEYGTTESDIYTYTFEAANASTDKTVYKNIHNITNKSDLVPYFYPEKWGIYLNGIKEYIGEDTDTVQTRIFGISPKSVIQDYKVVKKSAFLKEFADFVGENISREEYVSLLQTPTGKLMEICMSKNGEETAVLNDYFSDVMSSAASDSGMLAVIISLLGAPDSEASVSAVTDLLTKHMEQKKAEYDLPLTDEEYQSIQSCVKPFAAALLTLAAVDIHYKEKDENGKETDAPFYHLITFFENTAAAVDEHSSYKVIENTKAKDSYFTKGADIVPGNVYCGKWYSYDEYGEKIFEQARALGFIDSDIKKLKGGYNLSIENKIEPLNGLSKTDETKLDSMLSEGKKADGYYEIQINKKTGFREIPLDASLMLKSNSVTIEAKNSSGKYEVYALDEAEAKEIGCTAKTVNGSIQISFNASAAGKYAVIYEAEKTVVSDSFLTPLIGILLFVAVSAGIFFIAFILRNNSETATGKKKHRQNAPHRYKK